MRDIAASRLKKLTRNHHRQLPSCPSSLYSLAPWSSRFSGCIQYQRAGKIWYTEMWVLQNKIRALERQGRMAVKFRQIANHTENAINTIPPFFLSPSIFYGSPYNHQKEPSERKGDANTFSVSLWVCSHLRRLKILTVVWTMPARQPSSRSSMVKTSWVSAPR